MNSSAFIDYKTIKTLTVIKQNVSVTRDLLYKCAIDSLKSLGLEATNPPKTNNVLIDDKKISLSSIRIIGDVIAFAWSIALDFDYDLAEKTIVSPRNMREWVTSLKKELGRTVSVDELRDAIKQGFQQTLEIVFEDADLSAEELMRIDLLLPKYKSELWLKTGRWSHVKDYGLR